MPGAESNFQIYLYIKHEYVWGFMLEEQGFKIKDCFI